MNIFCVVVYEWRELGSANCGCGCGDALDPADKHVIGHCAGNEVPTQ